MGAFVAQTRLRERREIELMGVFGIEPFSEPL